MGAAAGLFAVLAAIATILVLAIAFVRFAGDRAISRRVGLVVGVRMLQPRAAEPVSAQQRSRADLLRRPFTLPLRRTWGVDAGPRYLLLVAAGGAAAIWLVGRLAFHLPVYVVGTGAALGFFLLPYFEVAREQRRSDAQFADMLPDAVDTVVRVVRAGLPVTAAIRAVGREGQPPLGAVFTKVADLTEIGMPLDQAMARTSSEIGNPDFHFMAVAIALQQATGGNLAETLETLSQIMRRRRAARLKAMAATAEVRISAIILGAIPFLVTGALLLAAPHYLDPLFSDPRGQIILGAALFGLLAAGLTMRAMIRNMLATA